MSTEIIIKLILVIVLVIAGFLYWFLPKTRLAIHFKMNESLFMLTGVVGIFCGLAGLTVSIMQPVFIIELHLWELIAVPFALVYFYWQMIEKINKGRNQWDEKQILNMTSAAAFAWSVSIPIMVFVFILYQSAVINGLIWFPIFFFQALLFYSAATLYYYKKA